MHESSLMTGLLKQLEQICADNAATRVKKIILCFGALSPMSPEHFKEHFAVWAVGRQMEHAELIIERNETLDDPNVQSILLKSVELETIETD